MSKQYKRAKGYRPPTVHVSNGSVTIYGTGTMEQPTFTEEDAARRLLASDDLLAACKAARDLLRKLGGTNHDPEYSELCAAIAKATGQ